MHEIIRVAALAAAVGVASADSAAAECVFAKLGELKIDTSRGTPMVEIRVNGKTGLMVINTGAVRSHLTAAGAQRLGVRPDLSGAGTLVSQRGEYRVTGGTLTKVVLGGAFGLERMYVNIEQDGGGSPDEEVVGSLGLDVLAASDLEFDFANSRIAFYQPKGCEKTPLAYWGPTYSLAEMRRPSLDRPQMVTKVKLNGRTVTAQIVTGMPYSVVARTAAQMAGVGPDSLKATAAPPMHLTGEERPAWIGVFDSFEIGDEKGRNVRLAFSELWANARYMTTGARTAQQADDLPQMMLGRDFLTSHRVLVANSQGKMYFTYSGGPIFARPATAAGEAQAK